MFLGGCVSKHAEVPDYRCFATIASTKYDADVNNCLDKAVKYHHCLLKNGVNSKVVAGEIFDRMKNESGFHAWVEFESNGEWFLADPTSKDAGFLMAEYRDTHKKLYTFRAGVTISEAKCGKYGIYFLDPTIIDSVELNNKNTKHILLQRKEKKRNKCLQEVNAKYKDVHIDANVSGAQATRQVKTAKRSLMATPVAVAKSSADDRSATQVIYKLALFPSHIYSTGWGDIYIKPNELKCIKCIASLASDDDRIIFKYSYQGFEGIPDGVTLIKDLRKGNVWKKETMFSKLKPDWEEVENIALKINANPIIMITGGVSTDPDKLYTFYLYDSKNNKVYSKKAKAFYNTFDEDVQIALSQLLQVFFKNQ